MSRKSEGPTDEQTLHLVFGGELLDLGDHTFRDPERLDVVGIYETYEKAHRAWRGAAQRTVDNAMMRYFIIPIHRLIDPDDDDRSPDVRR